MPAKDVEVSRVLILSYGYEIIHPVALRKV